MRTLSRLSTSLIAAFLGFFPWRAALPVVCGLLTAAVLTGLAPEPDPIPRRWQMDFEPGPLRIASVEVAGEGERLFFYMTYKVTNSSDSDLLFAPAFDLATNEGEVLRSGRDVPAAVTKELLGRLGNEYLEDQISIVGVLLQGEGNAKEGLVVWPATRLDLEDIAVYAAGFSGETRAVDVMDKNGNPSRVMLRKTLMLRYQTPGEIRNQGSRPFEVIENRWILR
mgnify:CR=1 FL=1